jgi:hypothetical protein
MKQVGGFLFSSGKSTVDPVCDNIHRIYTLHLIPLRQLKHRRLRWAEHIAHIVRKYQYTVKSSAIKTTNLYSDFTAQEMHTKIWF